MPDLTPKQLEVLVFIQRFMGSGGLPPTRGEIAQGLQLKNRQGIDQHLRALATKGAIELIPGTSRGIRLRKALPPLSAQRSRSSDTPQRVCLCWVASPPARRYSPRPTSRIT